jgi:hypothetical protein
MASQVWPLQDVSSRTDERFFIRSAGWRWRSKKKRLLSLPGSNILPGRAEVSSPESGGGCCGHLFAGYAFWTICQQHGFILCPKIPLLATIQN